MDTSATLARQWEARTHCVLVTTSIRSTTSCPNWVRVVPPSPADASSTTHAGSDSLVQSLRGVPVAPGGWESSGFGWSGCAIVLRTPARCRSLTAALRANYVWR